MNRCTNCGQWHDACHSQCEECRCAEAREADAPRKFYWARCYELSDGIHWALRDTQTDAERPPERVTDAYMVLVDTNKLGFDGRPLPEQFFPKLIAELLTAHFSKLSPRTMQHTGSPGGPDAAGDTFRCYNCQQPVERFHAKPDEGYCARCDHVVSERPPLMPGRPPTFIDAKGHTARRIGWSANGWCAECNDIVEEGE